MMTEREKREQFLRAHGSFSEREKRERLLQKYELDRAIEQLKNQVAGYDGHDDQISIALRNAWATELQRMLGLRLKLAQQKPIPAGRIRIQVNPVEVIGNLRRRGRETAALIERR
jgi:hypothetical protein